MKMRPITLVAFIAALLSAGAGTAQGQELFTITVPVRISNLLPDVEFISVTCDIGTDALPTDLTQLNVGSAARMGRASANAIRPDASGNFSDNAVVRFPPAYVQGDPSAATKYYCWFELQPRAGSTTPRERLYQPRPGSTFVRGVAGSLPR